MRLTVMTFNLLNATVRGHGSDWAVRREQAVQTIRRCSPDVLGIQEATAQQLADLASDLPEYALLAGPASGRSRLPAWAAAATPAALMGLTAAMRADGEPRGKLARAATWALIGAGLMPAAGVAASWWANGPTPDEGEYCALLYQRERLALEASRAFWLSRTPERTGSVLPGSWLPRMVTVGVLRPLNGGRSATVYNTHVDVLPWTWSASGTILRRLMDRDWSGDPQVLLGDFNAPAGSGLYCTLSADGAAPGLRDAWCEAAQRVGPPGTFHTGTGDGRWPGRVDRVFVRPAVRIVRAETVTGRECGVWPSDHFPVLADLDLTKDDLA